MDDSPLVYVVTYKGDNKIDFGIQFLIEMGWHCDASMYLDAECFSMCIDIINVFCNG